MLISFVIRARNVARELEGCFKSLTRQNLPPSVEVEFIVVDNESTDDSVQVALRFGAKIEYISRGDFTWGRALNRGIARSQGEYVVLISADVEPVGSQWLGIMLEEISNLNIVATYGRQIARADAPIDEVARLTVAFPPSGPTVSMMPTRTPNGYLCFLSNACALIRRSAWEKAKFDEASNGAEEQIWMEELLRQGYTYTYAANALAYHSHRDPLTRAGYRLWELHREQLTRQGKQPALGNIGYAVGAICKRRIKNVVTVKASARSRVEGIMNLPFEVTMFLVSGLLEAIGVDRRKVRNFMWQ